MSTYMDAEYYPEEKLTGKRRVLIALSNHIKVKTDEAFFARTYHQVLCEEYTEQIQHWCDTEVALSLTKNTEDDSNYHGLIF